MGVAPWRRSNESRIARAVKCRKEIFFLAPDSMWIYVRPECANGTEEEAKTTRHKMEYVVRKLNATDGVEVAERKLVTHFEKKMCRMHEFT
jgi:hypothetical protein